MFVNDVTLLRLRNVQQESDETEIVEAKEQVRLEPLGSDRHHRTYWRLRCVPGVVIHDGECLVHVFLESLAHESPSAWSVIDDAAEIDALIAALNTNGQRESALKLALQV